MPAHVNPQLLLILKIYNLDIYSQISSNPSPRDASRKFPFQHRRVYQNAVINTHSPITQSKAPTCLSSTKLYSPPSILKINRHHHDFQPTNPLHHRRRYIVPSSLTFHAIHPNHVTPRIPLPLTSPAGLEKILRLLQSLCQILTAFALTQEDAKIWMHLRKQFALGTLPPFPSPKFQDLKLMMCARRTSLFPLF